MQAQTFTKLVKVLSKDRLEACRPPGGSDEEAIRNYLWNVALCESLLCVLQTLEVAFRNSLHDAIGTAIQSPEWLLRGPVFVSGRELDQIAEAKQKLLDARAPLTEGRLVAELGFGFWTSLADSRYDKVWHRFIKTAFPHMPNAIRTRHEISSRANKVRRLRNAVFHHHTLWHWSDLAQQHADGFTLIEWIEPALASQARAIDRFPSVHSAGPQALRHLVIN